MKEHKYFLIALCEMVLDETIDHDHKQACTHCQNAREAIEALNKL